jgi:methionyl-tRNA synthetase
MIKNPKDTIVTAALIYANGPVHIGHLAGCYLPADVYALFYAKGKGRGGLSAERTNTAFRITIKAKKEGITRKPWWINTTE